jgi:hypothetical protein
VTGIADTAALLAPLQSFDSDAFRGDAEVPQELCNTILGFALVFNDCRDLLLLSTDLQEQGTDEIVLNRYFGEHGGGMTHVFRLLIGVVHELGEFIRENGKALHEPFFEKQVLPKLSTEHRAMWVRVRDLAQGGKSGVKMMDDLLDFLRNKTTYHYDGAELFRGYEARFPSGATAKNRQPVVSLGARVRNTRFYFADAVAYDLIEEGAESRGLMPLGPKLSNVFLELCTVLGRIVEVFLQARRPWRDFAEESAPPVSGTIGAQKSG